MNKYVIFGAMIVLAVAWAVLMSLVVPDSTLSVLLSGVGGWFIGSALIRLVD